MTITELIKALRRLKVSTGSISCLGCGYEHNCGIHGCAIIREAVHRLDDFYAVFNEEAVVRLAGRCLKVDPDRLRELAEADKDGRLVVRPYSIGETVYVLLKDGAIFYPETNGWYISEEIIEAISHDGFYLGDPVDDVYTPDSAIGKTVFLTKKAAKAALEAMKDG